MQTIRKSIPERAVILHPFPGLQWIKRKLPSVKQPTRLEIYRRLPRVAGCSCTYCNRSRSPGEPAGDGAPSLWGIRNLPPP